MDKNNEIIKILRERNEAVKTGDAQPFTVQELRNFVESASVKLPQSTEVAFVYSGSLFPDGKGGFEKKNFPPHFEILGRIVADNPNKIGMIDKTESAILMEHQAFQNALNYAADADGISAKAILYGTRAEDGIRQPDSISDKISSRFVAENKHIPFLAMTHFSASDSIYAQSEFPVFFMMKGESVQGIPRDALHNLANAHSIEEVRHIVGARSFEQMGKLKIAIDDNNYLVGYDTTEFWPDKFKHLGKRNIPDLPNVREIDFADVHKKVTAEQLKDLHRGTELSKATLNTDNAPVSAFKENALHMTGNRVGSGVGVGMGVYSLSQKLVENGTAAGDLKDDRTRKLAQTGIAADVAAIGVDSAEGLATLTKVSKGLESASRASRAAAPVAATLSVASGIIEYKIAEKKGDGKRAAEAVGSTAGGLTGALAGGVAGAKGGAVAGATIGAFFGGVGAVPGAAIGGFIGGIAGAVGGGWAGAEGGKAVSEAVLTDTFQKRFDEQQPTTRPRRAEQSRAASPTSREASNQPSYACDYSPYSPTLSAPPAKDFAASAPDLGKHFKAVAFGDAVNEAKFVTPNTDYSVQNRHVSAGQRLGL